MRFLLLLCADETTPMVDVTDECAVWSEENALVTSMGLYPPDTAGTLSVRDGEVLLTDGPFAETKEQMGGLAVIEAPSVAEARRVAATHPWAKVGMIEVRQIID